MKACGFVFCPPLDDEKLRGKENIGCSFDDYQHDTLPREERTMKVNEALCVGCGGCLSGYDGKKKCPTGALSLVGSTANIDKTKCVLCGQCKTLCALEAIEES
jgi:uncharacterized Fe-S center protein